MSFLARLFGRKDEPSSKAVGLAPTTGGPTKGSSGPGSTSGIKADTFAKLQQLEERKG